MNLRHVSRNIWRNISCIYIYIEAAPIVFDELHAAKMRDIVDQAARDRPNGFSLSFREAATTPAPNLGALKKSPSRQGGGEVVAKPPGVSGHHWRSPDKSLSLPTGFYLRPVKIARTRNRQIERDCCSREDCVESMVSKGCDEVGGAHMYIWL